MKSGEQGEQEIFLPWAVHLYIYEMTLEMSSLRKFSY
jgi:hypothetical protein